MSFSDILLEFIKILAISSVPVSPKPVFFYKENMNIIFRHRIFNIEILQRVSGSSFGSLRFCEDFEIFKIFRDNVSFENFLDFLKKRYEIFGVPRRRQKCLLQENIMECPRKTISHKLRKF